MDTKALRQKILDLATRGKLVPQDPNDEPASVLLERIRVEKQQMVKEGKLKPKDIKNDTIIFVGEDNLHYEKFQDGTVKCIEDEIPFEVPEGWAWCRLTEITFEIFAGGDKPENYSKTQTDEFSVPIFANGAENDGLYGFTNKARVNKSAITVSARGTIGFCCIRYMPFVPIVRLITIVPAEGINIEYLRIVFQALIETGEGSSIPQLTVPGIKPKLIPIPPYSEQTRISNKLIETEKIVSAVELNQESVVNYIKLAKSKILDLAIRGQLVPQDPNDEPASVLLERIRAEKEELKKAGKIKRDKKESVIFKGEDNSYYQDLPKNWEKTTLRKITTPLTLNDGDWILTENMNANGEVKLLQLGSIGNMMYIDKGFKFLTKQTLDELSCTAIFPNYLIINRIISDKMCCCIIPNIEGTIITTVDTCWIAPCPQAYNLKFLMYQLASPTFQSMVLLKATGTTRKRISKNNLIDLPLLFPPLAEQKRIVEAIEAIFAQLNEITNSIA